MIPLLRATRPKTLIASLSPMCIGTSMAIGEGTFHFWVFLLTLLTGLGIQISTNFANDLYDYIKGADTEKRKGPVRVTASGLLSVAQMKLATFAIMCFTFLAGSTLILRGGILIGVLVALALLLAYAYTAGPFPLAYLGLAEFFVLIFFGPMATGFTYYLQTLKFQTAPFLAGLSPGLISCGLLIINNLRDVTEDKEARKKTLVARFGTRFGKGEYTAALLLATLLPLLFISLTPLVSLSLICLPPALLLIHNVLHNTEPRKYNPLLEKTGKLLTLYTFIFSLSYCL
jgi:1,4-dihydroxy-2-naphthoate polyprenyltransferase